MGLSFNIGDNSNTRREK